MRTCTAGWWILDRFQEICSVFQYRRETPKTEDVATFMDIGDQIKTFVKKRLITAS